MTERSRASVATRRRRVVALYVDQQWRIADIAAELGISRSAVHRHLDAAGVEKRDDRHDAVHPRREVCFKGLHPLTEDNIRIDTKGKRNCIRCEQTRWLIYDQVVRDKKRSVPSTEH